ncbi:MAG: hypothetical protein WDN49_25045 [Acetobacteraceae bacterium]
MSRRLFLRGTAAALPAAAIASAGFTAQSAWAQDAKALSPHTMASLVKMSRDIYPHDHIGDSFYVAAVLPWDEKAAKDPAFLALMTGGIARLDADAKGHPRHRLPRRPLGGRPGGPAAGASSTRRSSSRPAATRRVALQPAGAVAEAWLRGALRRAWRLPPSRLRRHRLAAGRLKGTTHMAQFDLNDDSVVCIVGSGAGGRHARQRTGAKGRQGRHPRGGRPLRDPGFRQQRVGKLRPARLEGHANHVRHLADRA